MMKGQLVSLDRDKFKDVLERLEDGGALSRQTAATAGGGRGVLTWKDRVALAWRVDDIRALLQADASLGPFLS